MKGQVFVGDIIKLVMSNAFPDEKAQAIITSPPYYGVRWYDEVEPTIWDGDPDCDHDFSEVMQPPRQRKASEVEHVAKGKLVNGQKFDAKPSYFCVKCGAWKGQLGQEPNPDLYAEHLADILTMLPLRPDGTLWVNIKDTAISGKGMSGRASAAYNAKRRAAGATISSNKQNIGGKGVMLPIDNMKEMRKFHLRAKSLALVPARLALAMQKRGWIYRSEIIWKKTNPMPESVIDRLPSITEVIQMYVLRKHYKFYRNAITIWNKTETMARYDRGVNPNKHNTTPQLQRGIGKPRASKHGAHITGNGIHKRRLAGKPEWQGGPTRSLNNVWEIPTANHSSDVGIHVAPMPGEIPRRCIMLSTQPGDLVLDPFGGTGTVGAVAEILERRWWLADADPRLAEFTADTLNKHRLTPSFSTHGEARAPATPLFATK